MLKLLLLPLLLAAQTQPAPTPEPKHLILPPGFKIIEAAGRRVVADPADEPWIRKAMTELAPATRPATNPTNILDKFTAARADLAKQFAADLALPDTDKLNASFDAITQTLTKFRDLNPPIYYLATSRDRLRAIAKAGWETPGYYYNRVTDEVMVDPGMHLSVESPMDDMLLPALYLDDAKPDARAAALQRMVQQVEHVTVEESARRAQVALQVSFITFIVDNAFKPLNLKPGQDWLAVGVSGVLSAKFASQITGANQDWILRQMTYESPRTVIKAAGIDLLHPTDLSALRDQAVPFYLDAIRRKATLAAQTLIDKAGTPGVAKVLTALRASLPADGPALISLIKQQTDVDLSAQVLPANPPAPSPATP